jgi:hypothetical protein
MVSAETPGLSQTVRSPAQTAARSLTLDRFSAEGRVWSCQSNSRLAFAVDVIPTVASRPRLRRAFKPPHLRVCTPRRNDDYFER